jgi:hypothetical protein
MIPAEPSIVDIVESGIGQGIVYSAIFTNTSSSPTTKAPLTNAITSGPNALANQEARCYVLQLPLRRLWRVWSFWQEMPRGDLSLMVSDFIWVSGMANMPDA